MLEALLEAISENLLGALLEDTLNAMKVAPIRGHIETSTENTHP